jgi:hypothetical protein
MFPNPDWFRGVTYEVDHNEHGYGLVSFRPDMSGNMLIPGESGENVSIHEFEAQTVYMENLRMGASPPEAGSATTANGFTFPAPFGRISDGAKPADSGASSSVLSLGATPTLSPAKDLPAFSAGARCRFVGHKTAKQHNGVDAVVLEQQGEHVLGCIPWHVEERKSPRGGLWDCGSAFVPEGSAGDTLARRKRKERDESMDGAVADYHWINFTDTGPEEWVAAALGCEAESAGMSGWERNGTWRDDAIFGGAHCGAEAGEWGAGKDVDGGESAVNVFACSAAELRAAAGQCCPIAARSSGAACVALGPAPHPHAGLESEAVAVREPKRMIKELVHRVILDEFQQQICLRGPAASRPDADRKRLKDHLKQVSLAAMEGMLRTYCTLMSSPSAGATPEHILSGAMAIDFAKRASAQLAPDLVWITRQPKP